MVTSEAWIRSCTPFDPISHTTPARVPDGDNVRAGGEQMVSVQRRAAAQPMEAYRWQVTRSTRQKPER